MKVLLRSNKRLLIRQKIEELASYSRSLAANVKQLQGWSESVARAGLARDLSGRGWYFAD